MSPPPETRWRAAADGVGHAVLLHRGRQVRSICGRPLWAERLDHPVADRCAECTAGLDRLTAAALSGPQQIPGTW